MDSFKIGDNIIIYFHNYPSNDETTIQKFVIYQIFSDPEKGKIYKLYINNIDDHDYKTALFLDHDIWNIIDYDSPHTIIFNPPIKLQLLPKDLLFEIIHKLQSKEIYKFITINKYFNEKINEEYWRLRVRKHYPDVYELKLSYQTWKEFFKLIHKSPRDNEIRYLTEHNEVKLLQWLIEKYNYKITRNEIQIAVDYGKIDILNLLKKNLFREYYNAELDYSKLIYLPNAIQILEWIHRDDNFMIDIDLLFFDGMKINRLDILEWLDKNNLLNGIEDYTGKYWENSFNVALSKDYFEIFQWLEKNHFIDDEIDNKDKDKDKDKYYQYIAGIVATNNSEKILNLLISRGIYPKIGINTIDLLLRLEKLGAKFDYELLDDAIDRNNTEISILLIQRKIYPTLEGYNNVIKKGRIKILKLLYNIFPLTSNDMNIAIRYNHFNILKWGDKKNIFPDTNGANEAVINNNIDILNWLAEKGIAPNQRGANFAIENNNLILLQWMFSFKVYPDQDHIDLAAIKNLTDIVKFLGDKGYFPDPTKIEKFMGYNHYEIMSYLSLKGMFGRLKRGSK